MRGNHIYFCGEQWQAIDEAAWKMSERASLRWRDLADIAGLSENRPSLLHYDCHHHRIDRIVQPKESRLLKRG